MSLTQRCPVAAVAGRFGQRFAVDEVKTIVKLNVEVGDVLEYGADVLVSTANPWLNMSGGVNGAIRMRCPEIQTELREWQQANSKAAVPAGTVVPTSAGSLPFDHIIHAVAIDPFYDTSAEVVTRTVTAAFELARKLQVNTISMPTLATGYGPLTVAEFACAMARIDLCDVMFKSVTVVVRSAENAEVVRSILVDSGDA